MDKKNITETLNAANEYLNCLKSLETDLDYAVQQINTTAEEAEVQISTVFSNLIRTITFTLLSKREELINNAKEIQKLSILPLQKCQTIIENNIKDTKSLINIGNDLLQSGDRQNLSEFNNKSSLLGSLPEVPPLKEVPYISFQYENADEYQIVDKCRNYGSVIHIAPVQISTLSERPGAILVEWNVSESEEHILDVETYHLQWAFGDVSNKYLESNFHSCYTGPDLQYLLKDLNLNQDYQFRVCCKFEGDTTWSPWSLPQVGRTSIKPFSWEANVDFVLSNENKIATPLNDAPSILHSSKIDFNVGYSVEFTFLECGNKLENNFIGLLASTELKDLRVTTQAVCVEANGNIYGSGVKKTTQFSPVVKGSKICFTCDYKNENKLRINIDSGDSRVTYDWTIDNGYLYIGAQFDSTKWKIMLE